MALADFFLFPNAIPPSQKAVVAFVPVVARITYFASTAILDELLFRLLAMSALVWILVSKFGTRDWCYWAPIAAVAFAIYPVLHPTYLSSLDPTYLTVTREIMLHGTAGMLWGYLYWRCGLAAAMVGHIAAHLSLQPLLSVLF